MRKSERKYLKDDLSADPSESYKGGEANLVGAAYVGQPTREKALVFAYGGQEYLIPVVNQWDGHRIVESTVSMDKIERVVTRPNGTSCISKMKRSKEVSAPARSALLAAVKAWFLPEKGYTFTILGND